MAFIRKRRTSSGNLSTALVEPYRDNAGRPRQRVLANLYGCETTLEALAKLSAQRHRLRQERKEIETMLATTNEWAADVRNNVSACARWPREDAPSPRTMASHAKSSEEVRGNSAIQRSASLYRFSAIADIAEAAGR